MTCGIHSRLREACGWLAEQCRGVGCRQGHVMEVVNGLMFRRRCGRYTRKPGLATKGLKQECSGVPAKHAGRFLRRVAAVPPLPPYGSKAWPDGTPAADAGRRKARKIKDKQAASSSSTEVRSRSLVPVLGKHFLEGFTAGSADKRRRPPEPASDAELQIVQFAQPSGTVRRARFLFGRDPGNPAREEVPSKAVLQFAALRARIRAKEAANQASQEQPP